MKELEEIQLLSIICLKKRALLQTVEKIIFFFLCNLENHNVIMKVEFCSS